MPSDDPIAPPATQPAVTVSQPAPATPAPTAISTRRFGDHAAARQALFDNALEAVKGLGPVENTRYRIDLSDVGYGKQPQFTLADHTSAVLSGRSLAHRMTATVNLTDKGTGTVVDRRRMTVASIPYLTRQGVFVLDGTPMAVSTQMRLDPGVYTRKKSNGQIEAHVAFLPGGGVPHRVHLDPETGVFKVTVGQAELPAAPLLHILGATDEELKKAWGDELAAVNLKAVRPHHLDRYYEKFGPSGPPPADPEELKRAVAARLSAYRFDPWITKRTLGRPHEAYDKAAALSVTKKLLDVAHGRVEPDDRDHPAYASVWAPEHLVAERLARSRPAFNKILWQATNTGSLKGLTPGFLNGSVRALFTKSGLGNMPEGSNAAEFMDHGSRITKVGEGGIGRSSDSVPMSARSVNIGQMPFIDLVRTSECFDPETEVMTIDGWKKWPAVTSSDRFACLIDDRLEFHNAERLYVHDHCGKMFGARNRHLDYLVTPAHRFWVRPHGMNTWRWRTAEETHGRSVHHQSAGHRPWVGEGGTAFSPPAVIAEDAAVGDHESEDSSRRKLGTSRLQLRHDYPVEPFAELLGWYLGEGSVRIRTDRGRNNVHSTVISQSADVNPDKCARIARCIEELGLRGRYYSSTKGFIIANKQLTNYFKQFGYSDRRWIPREFLSAPAPARRRMYEALLLAEGTKRKSGQGYGTFSSTSKRLAEDFALLAFSLGFSTRTSVYVDKREERYLPVHLVTIHSRDVRQVHNEYVHTYRGHRPSEYYVTDYAGKVYCATVPGGKLYVRRNGSCGFWSGNSESVGVDLRTAFGTKIGSDRRIYAPLQLPSGRIVYKTPRDLADSVVAFPGWKSSTDPLVPVVKKGKLGFAKREEVDYFVPSMEQTFSPMTNMVPMKSASKPHRSSMGGRMITQSLPLNRPEAPLVRSGVPGQPGKSFEELYGRHMGAAFARPDVGGVVTAVTPDELTVRYDDGSTETHELYNAMPSGRKTGYQSYPLVQPGTRFAPGQILSKSNYTDDKGHAAYGVNARIAFMPHKGNVYEDSLVVSKSLADRMTSHHVLRHQLATDENTTTGRVIHTAAFPGKYTLDTLKTLDDDGVIKPGTVVDYGHPLILGVRRKEGGYAKLSRSGRAGVSDASEVWEHNEPGKVVGVRRTSNGPVVIVETFKSMKDGDKISGRHGNKGVVKIIPDHEMPVGEDGRPVEAVISSLGTINRVNPSAVFEAALGKVAAKTGAPYVVHDFEDGQNLGKFVEDELAKHGTKFTETVTDPETGRPIPNVGVGNLYLMKLSHMAANKAKGRGLGGYDETGQPTRGSEGGALRASLGDTAALMSYGALTALKDKHLGTGQANDAFWQAYMAGFPVKTAHSSAAFDRFLTELKAAGVNPVREGSRYRFMGLTAKDVDELAQGRVVKNGETLDASRDNKPYPGGLHDENIFGATDSKSAWAAVPLHEPVLNPVFEEPARRLLGLTENQFRDTIAGSYKMAGDRTGMAGIVEALRGFDVKGALEKARADLKGTRKTAREAAARKLGYLKHLDATGRTPADWVWDKLPVLPPAFRPVTPGRSGSPAVVADANLLYRDAIEANEALKTLAPKVADVGAERLNLYDAVKAVTGLGDPISAKNAERGVTGILGKLLGDTSKASFMQQKLLGTPVDLSGRGQVLPSPDLDVDQLGLPEAIAWDVYHPFVVRRLVRNGVPRIEAAKMATERTEVAKRALLDEMEARPVIATRYPVLHRYGTIGFRPKLVAGSAILSNNLINKPMGLDHDGDQQINSVIVLLQNEHVVANIHGVPPTFWEHRDMTARFRTSVPGYDSDAERYFCVHLQDFPHGDKIGEKEGVNGLIEFFAVDPRIRVVAYDQETGRPTVASVAGWSVHHNRRVETVELLSGRQIVSDDDERAVYGIDPATMTFVRARPRDAKGLMVPRVDRFDPSGGLKTVVCRDEDGRPSVAFDLTENCGYVFGALAGNGWASGMDGDVRQIHLACTNRGVEAEFRKAFLAEFGERTHIGHTTVRAAADATGYGASGRLTISWAELARQVRTLVGSGARNKHLPPFFLSGDEAFRRGLFRGLMDTDGAVAVSSGKAKPQLVANYASSSLRLVQETQHLARSLGVSASISATKTPAGDPFWLLNLSGPDFYRLGLRLSHTEKAEKLRAAPEPSATSSSYARGNMLPLSAKLIPLVRKHIKAKTHPTLYYGIAGAVATNRVSRDLAARLVDALPADFCADDPMWQTFRRLMADESTAWDAVTGYTDTGITETGYDLTVPGFETFMSTDGLILSNTFTVSLPLSDGAVKEVYDKLLPSKNLFSPASFKGVNWLPNMEYQGGLHAATAADDKNPPVEFDTLADAKRAFREGHIGYGTRVRIRES